MSFWFLFNVLFGLQAMYAIVTVTVHEFDAEVDLGPKGFEADQLGVRGRVHMRLEVGEVDVTDLAEAGLFLDGGGGFDGRGCCGSCGGSAGGTRLELASGKRRKYKNEGFRSSHKDSFAS